MSTFENFSALFSRHPRKPARRRQQVMSLELLEQRLALSTVSGGNVDNQWPMVKSISLPASKTYGTGSALTFKLNFNEPVNVVGNQSEVSLPVEVGYSMRDARYVSGSGTRSLTFRMDVTANDVDTDGISLGRVNSSAVRDFDFSKNQILDLAGNPANKAIPFINTSRIRVDGTGPVVSGYSSFATKDQKATLQVNFDGPVFVTGKPTVPVTIEGVDRELVYAGGSGTSKLTFAATMPRGTNLSSISFRSSIGQVILLPNGVNLKDPLGNNVTPVGGDFGKTYHDNKGNRVVVIGAHYEKLGSVKQADLDKVFTEERNTFNPSATEAYWKDYVAPVYEPTVNDVDLYRVAYRSTIPEQGNRPTVAYGLVAIPHGATGPLPMVSVQHGTLFLKESAPSQAFSWDKNSTAISNFGMPQKELYGSSYETRLNVAQFAGHGYAVIAPDYFGIGNSVENDSFVVKQSEQQACLDMYNASQELLKTLKLSTSDLFLNGWSQGALVALSFQETLEAKGVKISGVSTAATPANTEMFGSRFVFNPRPYSEVTVPDAAWSIFVHSFSAFALSSYSGKTNAPLELFGGNYEVARKLYMRDFKTPPEFTWEKDIHGAPEPVVIIDGVTFNAEVPKFIAKKYSSDPRAYLSTAFSTLISNAGSGQTRLISDMKMYYGAQDEGYPAAVCTIVDTWQRGTYGKTNIEQVEVPSASHRSTFLTAVYGQLDWFNSKRRKV